MINCATSYSLAILLFGVGLSYATERIHSASDTNLLAIHAVEVEGKSLRLQRGRELNLGAFPRNIVFNFGPVGNSNPTASRLRCKLNGFDKDWHPGDGKMSLMIRFYNKMGDRISQKSFTVEGDSLGWNGSMETSALTHRRETIVVPQDASRLWVVISSAGPPSTMGIYIVDDLIVSKISTTGETPEVLLKSPFDHRTDKGDEIPKDWVRDGTTPTMAKIIGLDSDAKTKVFAIIDSDPLGHCEWHNAKEFAPPVTPNENLVVEWNELFAIGVGDNRSIRYPTLSPGHYEFEVQEVTVLGQLTA